LLDDKLRGVIAFMKVGLGAKQFSLQLWYVVGTRFNVENLTTVAYDLQRDDSLTANR